MRNTNKDLFTIITFDDTSFHVSYMDKEVFQKNASGMNGDTTTTVNE